MNYDQYVPLSLPVCVCPLWDARVLFMCVFYQERILMSVARSRVVS